MFVRKVKTAIVHLDATVTYNYNVQLRQAVDLHNLIYELYRDISVGLNHVGLQCLRVLND